MKKTILVLFLLLIINNIYAYESYEPLDYHAIKTQYIDVNVKLDMPVTISRYKTNDSFVYKTRMFTETSYQKVDANAFFYDNLGNKIYAEIEEDDYDNKFAVFKVDPITRSEYVFSIEANIVFENKLVLNNQMYDLSEPITNEIAEEDVEYFMQPTRFIKSQEPEIINLVENIKQTDDALSELALIVKWVNENIDYDLAYADVMLDAVETLKTRKGVCNEISILTAAMLRARGFPVKFVVGLANSSESWGPHAWLEVFIPEQGWIIVDPTYNEIGFVDATHVVFAKLRDSSDSEDIITTRNNDLLVSFDEKTLTTNINEQRSFSNTGFDGYVDVDVVVPSRIKSGSMLDVKVNLRNTTANTIAFLGFLAVHDDFYPIKQKSSSEVFILKPFEEIRRTYYYILPDLSQTMYYSLEYVTQFGDKYNQIIIGPNERIFNSAFFVGDPLIYFSENNLIVDVDVYNYTDQQKTISFMFSYLDETITEEKTINQNMQENVVYEIPVAEEGEVDFVIDGDYQYHRIIKILPELEIVVDDVNKEVVGVQVGDVSDELEYEEVFKNIDEKEDVQALDMNVLFISIVSILFVLLIVFMVVKTKFNK